MSKFFDESKEQSQVKAEIVSKYFDAWARIIGLKTRSDRIVYLDLFAGPGRYNDGTASTPLLVLQKALADDKLRKMLVTIFNDKDEDNTQSLEKAIKLLPGVKGLKHDPVVLNEEVGTEMVKLFSDMNDMAPTLFFVDPWGYKGLSLQLVNSVVKNWACECIFFFNYNRVSMGLPNPVVESHMNALFGQEKADELRAKIKGLPAAERETAIIEGLSEALNPTGKRFVLPFRFRNASGARTSHHIIFVSKSFLGYEIMKGIMAKYSSTVEQGVPAFEYNPADEKYPVLFELNRPLDQLRQMLLDEHPNKTIPFMDLYMSHSVGRRYIRANYKDILRKMCGESVISARTSDGRTQRRNTFPDDMIITFPKKKS